MPADGVFTHALYAHDGQNLFDPGAFFGGWQLEKTLPPKMLLIVLRVHSPTVSPLRM